MICFPCFRFAIAVPKITVLFDSVPPEVKNISFGFTFRVAATCSRAWRKYFSASKPFVCFEDGFP